MYKDPRIIPRFDPTGRFDSHDGRGITAGDWLVRMPVKDSLLRDVRKRVAELDAQKEADATAKK